MLSKKCVGCVNGVMSFFFFAKRREGECDTNVCAIDLMKRMFIQTEKDWGTFEII